MEITVVAEALSEPLELPCAMQELSHDWHGEAIDPPARFQLVEDPAHLWLIAGRQKAAKPHPMGNCGDFQAELWKHDVAELFIANPDGTGYLEFNLSPVGAWWMERFSGPRQVEPLESLPPVRTLARAHEGGSWAAAMGIPVGWLRDQLSWGDESRANVTFILESPQQRFLTVGDLGGGEPDYHRPYAFGVVRRHLG